MSVYTLNFICPQPPMLPIPIRMAQGALDPVSFAITDLYGNPISIAGKTVQLRVYTDDGATQVDAFTHSLSVSGSMATWQPITSDTQTPVVFRYIVTDQTDNQELAWGVLSVFGV